MQEIYEQTVIGIQPSELLDKVVYMKEGGYRLVQICATPVGEGRMELTYSFDLEYRLVHLRTCLEPEQEIMSVTGIFWPAFVYENEMKDLFGVKIKHIPADSDYNGEFIHLDKRTPWKSSAPDGTEGK